MNATPSRLESFELSVMMESGEKHAEDWAALDQAFDLIIHCFEDLHTLPDSEREIDLHEARMLLAVRIFKGLRSARILCQYGYYEQSLVLVRTSIEHLLVTDDIEIHRETFDALKRGDRFNIGDLAYRNMVERVAAVHPDENFKERWDRTYKLLNEYVHPGGSRRQQIPLPEGAHGYAIPFGTYYDGFFASVTLHLIKSEVLKLMLLMRKIAVSVGNEWDAQRVYEALASLAEKRPQA